MESNLTEAEKAEYLSKFKEYWHPPEWKDNFMIHASKCIPISLEPGKVAFEYTVTRDSLNLIGSVHGGCIGTLFDNCMGFCFWVPDGTVPQLTVTADLLVTYINAARLYDVLLLEAQAIAIRDNLLFVEGRIVVKETRALLATAKQTLAVIGLDSFVARPLKVMKEMENAVIPVTDSDEFYILRMLDWETPEWEKSFSYFGRNCKLIAATPGHFFYEFTVFKPHSNTHDYLHGGCLLTLIDICCTFTTHTTEPMQRVTVTLGVSFVGSAKIGETLIIETKCPKEGKNMAYVTVKVYKKHNRIPVATAQQTMATIDVRRMLQKSNL